MSAAGPIEPEKKPIGRPFEPGNQSAAGHGPGVGNRNSTKHGLRALRTSTLSRLPCPKVTRQVLRFRRWLEQETIQVHGKVSLGAELAINTACRFEATALLASRWLRLQGETMSAAERLSYLQAVGVASEKRDKAVDRLDLEKDTESLYGSLYGATVSPLNASDNEGT